jgi:hypothetical protein
MCLHVDFYREYQPNCSLKIHRVESVINTTKPNLGKQLNTAPCLEEVY